MKVDPGELLGDLVEEAVLREALDLGGEIEPLENVPHRGRERLIVGEQVLADMVLIAHELAHIEGGRVVETLPGLAQEERVGIEPRLRLVGELGEHGRLGGLQNAVEAPEDGEREDDLAVFGLFVVAAQEVRHGPDKGRKGLMVHADSPANKGHESLA